MVRLARAILILVPPLGLNEAHYLWQLLYRPERVDLTDECQPVNGTRFPEVQERREGLVRLPFKHRKNHLAY